MSRLRNNLLRLVARASVQAAHERLATTRCTAALRYERFRKSSSACSLLYFSKSGSRCFSSEVNPQPNSFVKLVNATWSGCPQPQRQTCKKDRNGVIWKDEYSWMDPIGSGRSDTSRSLRQHLQQEDCHTRRALAASGVEGLKQRLLVEMRDLYLGHSQEPPPERLGPYVYSATSGPDGGLESYVRRRTDPDQEPAGRGGAGQQRRTPPRVPPPPHVLLDRPTVAADSRRAVQLTGLRLGDTVGALKLCPSHRLLAYSLPLSDRPDVFCVLVRDTATGKLLLPGGVVCDVAGPGGMELAADGRSLLVTSPDELGRPSKVVLHDLHCATAPRVLLTETDPRFFLALGRTKDWTYLLLSSNSKTSSEVHLLDAARPGAAPPRLVQPRRPGLEYFVEHHQQTQTRTGFVEHTHNQQSATNNQQTRIRTPGAGQQQQQQQGGPTSELHGGVGMTNVGGGGAEAGSGGGQGEGEGQLIILTNVDPLTLRVGAAAGGGGRRGEGGVPGGGGGGGGELVVVSAPVSRPGLEHWRPLLPERPGVVVTDLDMFADCCVLYERRNGLPAVSVLPMPPPLTRAPDLSSALAGDKAAGRCAGGECGGGGGFDDCPQDASELQSRVLPVQVPLPPWALHVTPGINADPLSPTLRLTASSPLHPPATLDYHLRTGRMQLLARGAAPPAARELLRRCSLLRLQVQGGAPRGGGGAGGGVCVPVTLVLPPGVTFPQALGAGWGTSEKGAGMAEKGVGTSEKGVGTSEKGAGMAEMGAGAAGASGSAVRGPAGSRVEGGGGPAAAAGGGWEADEGVAPGVSWRLIAPPHEDGDGHPQNRGQGQEEAEAEGAGPTWTGLPGPRPLLLSVYGAYGLPLELQYDPTLLCLLARGWAVARVHVRGGGELGRGWHSAGSRRLKRAGVEDCLAAVEALTATGLTAEGLVAGHAISAGGVVLGAALNAAPGAWGAAVLRCAFLELLDSCSDPSQPLAAHEWDEWGDPADPRDWAALGVLCPYRNLEGGVGGGWRAAVLASCAAEDPRVPPGIPAKWVARLRYELSRQQGATGHYHPAGISSRGGGGGSERAGGTDGVSGSPAWRRLLGWVRMQEGGGDDGSGRVGKGGSGSDDRYDEFMATLPGPDGLGSARGGGGNGAGGGGGGGDGNGGVCAPLLRVYTDGTGHVRAGEAQADEVAEEMAFLLAALAGPATSTCAGVQRARMSAVDEQT